MKKISLLLIMLLVLTSCQIFPRQDDISVGSFKIEVNIEEAIPATVSIIYENADGISSTALLNLQHMVQTLYTSDNINIESGNYNLMQCFVLDANDSIIAATPLVGSDMAGSVSETLPLDFRINKDVITTISPEITSFSGSDTPEKYGYTSATATIIGLYDDFGQSINSFSFDFLREVSEEGPQNVFISPVSLVYAFGLLHPGCGNEAAQEIKDVFYLNDLTQSDEELYQLFMDFGNYLHTLDDGVNLSLAHAFWYDNNLTPTNEYLTMINTYFGAETDQVDFNNTSNVVDEINDWAAENTNNKIEEVVTESDVAGWIAALANATYFKGLWVNGFNKNNTREQLFFKDDSSSVTCDMMHGGTVDEPFRMKYYCNNELQLARIPFKDKSRYEMACLMPLDKTCEEFLADLDGDDWSQLMDNSHSGELILNMPKFEEEHKYYLPTTLHNLGMQAVFSNGALSRMFTNSTDFAVDDVIQSTYISVDETGAEAAAVTIIGVRGTVSLPTVLELTFNHPFIYTIQDAETHAIIFLGIMKDPTAE